MLKLWERYKVFLFPLWGPVLATLLWILSSIAEEAAMSIFGDTALTWIHEHPWIILSGFSWLSLLLTYYSHLRKMKRERNESISLREAAEYVQQKLEGGRGRTVETIIAKILELAAGSAIDINAKPKWNFRTRMEDDFSVVHPKHIGERKYVEEYSILGIPALVFRVEAELETTSHTVYCFPSVDLKQVLRHLDTL